MNFHSLKKYILSAAILFSAAACDNYLDLTPISEETSSSAYSTANQIEAALTGAYETFQSSDYYVWDQILLEDVRTDNDYAGGDNPEIFAIDLFNITPTNSRVLGWWSSLYNGILKANTVIDRIQNVTDPKLTDERRQQIKGEALFLRALHYYNLAKNWGGVPLVLESTTTTDPGKIQLPRASEAEVYAQILKDLDEAAKLLPDTYGSDATVNKARATAGAAYALAAKVCAQEPSHDYAKALEYIAKVEASSANYRLLNNYADLFDGNHYNNAESILEVQYTGGSEGNWAPQMMLPPSLSGDTWRKFVVPSHNLIDAYDAEGDVVRKNASVIFEKVTDWVDEYWGNAKGSSIPFAYKMKNAMGWASTDRLYILRYGDIVLLKAEALNETGDLTDAAAEVNKIRARVNLAPLTAAQTASKDALRTAILNERRLELAQEGQRWDDLKRHNLVVSTMNNLQEIDLRTGQPTQYNVTEAKTLLPIPQQELDRNPQLEQNPL